MSAMPAHAAEAEVTDAVFSWGVNVESGSGAYAPGTCNFLSAGVSGDAGKSAPWATEDPKLFKAEDGNVKILRPGAGGTAQPITWDNKCQTAEGAKVNTRGVASGNYAQISAGTGVVDTETDTGTIEWKGSFTIVYYSGYTYWTISDPKLEVTNGHGKLTGTFSGYGADMDDPSKWEKLPQTTGTIADFSNTKVDLTETGFTVTPDYAGVDSGQDDQDTSKDGWGSFPRSWVDFNVKTGQAQYWYTSGGSADGRKPATPITASYTVAKPSPTEDPVEELTTDHTVSGASKEAGLSVEVSGEGYGKLPNSSTGPAMGVYVTIVDRALKTADVTANNVAASEFVRVSDIKDGKLRTAVTAPVSALSKDKDYDVLLWTAHGFPKGDAVLYREPITLTAEQQNALFPEDPKPTDEPSADPKPTDEPSADPKPTDDPDRTIDAKLDSSTVTPGESVTIDGLDALNGDRVQVIMKSQPVDLGEFTVADGAITLTVPADAAPGRHTFEIRHNGETVAELPFEVVKAESPAEPAITVESETVALSDFLNKDKGALVTATGLTPGATYEIAVKGGTDVDGVTLTETADDNGVAAYRVYGLSEEHAKRYLGEYTVTMTDPQLTASFTVVADDEDGGGGSDDSDSGQRGSDQPGSDPGKRGTSESSALPRTGAEISGAAIGLALVAVGGAATLVTRRRRG